MITEKLLKKLGFIKTHVTIEEIGSEAFYYYILEIGNDYEKFCLISNEDKNNLYIEMFNYSAFRFTNINDLTILIEILKKNLIKTTKL